MREPLDLTLLAAACVQEGFPEPQREYRFHPVRKWMFDLAFPPLLVAFERDGMGRGTPGRHQTAAGFAGDCEKLNEAALLGWVVIRATGRQMRTGEAATWLIRALELARHWQRAADECKRLHLAMAGRIADQSELLSRRAERRGA